MSRHDEGMRARREVLGDDHVARARHPWDDVWVRPGPDRRTRSVVTLTALVVCDVPAASPASHVAQQVLGSTP